MTRSHARRWQLTDTQRVLCRDLLEVGDLTEHERNRLRILLWIDGGKGWRQVIRESHMSADVISRTIRNYRIGGLEGVLFPSFGEKAPDTLRPASNSRFRDLMPQLMRLAHQEPPLSLEQIAAATGYHKSSISRILHRLGIDKPRKERHYSAETRAQKSAAMRELNRRRKEQAA